MENIFANIFFCEKVQGNSDRLDVIGAFSITKASNNSLQMRSIPFTIYVNAAVFEDINDVDKGKSLYYILEARQGNKRKHKLLKELKVTSFNKSSANTLHSNNAFEFPNRNLIAEPGEYFVRIYYTGSNKTANELISDSNKKLVSSQVLIVEE